MMDDHLMNGEARSGQCPGQQEETHSFIAQETDVRSTEELRTFSMITLRIYASRRRFGCLVNLLSYLGMESLASCQSRRGLTAIPTLTSPPTGFAMAVLHNPRSDRRTTEGTFHIVEEGLAIPGDKKSVPRPGLCTALFRHAVAPPPALMIVPFTAHRPRPLRTFVSLLLRPIVCPKVPGVCLQKTMEIHFFAPGGLISNLDFVESIFGNAGDPYLPGKRCWS